MFYRKGMYFWVFEFSLLIKLSTIYFFYQHLFTSVINQKFVNTKSFYVLCTLKSLCSNLI